MRLYKGLALQECLLLSWWKCNTLYSSSQLTCQQYVISVLPPPWNSAPSLFIPLLIPFPFTPMLLPSHIFPFHVQVLFSSHCVSSPWKITSIFTALSTVYILIGLKTLCIGEASLLCSRHSHSTFKVAFIWTCQKLVLLRLPACLPATLPLNCLLNLSWLFVSKILTQSRPSLFSLRVLSTLTGLLATSHGSSQPTSESDFTSRWPS